MRKKFPVAQIDPSKACIHKSSLNTYAEHRVPVVERLDEGAAFVRGKVSEHAARHEKRVVGPSLYPHRINKKPKVVSRTNGGELFTPRPTASTVCGSGGSARMHTPVFVRTVR